ncbi:MAG: SDR family NAD(P)-dependent oxidoreductase [Burkholderiaceae bacterium]
MRTVIIGAGPGISASLARQVRARGGQVLLAARDEQRLEALAADCGAHAFACDAADPREVAALFEQADRTLGGVDLMLYNPSRRVPGAITDLDPVAVRQAIDITAYGAFLAAQQATRRMLAQGGGALLFTGATAGVKGFARSAAFAMGKFALRGLAQSLARELHPQRVHVVHLVVDGSVYDSAEQAVAGADDARLDPDAVASAFLAQVDAPPSAWSWEIELRPYTEKF